MTAFIFTFYDKKILIIAQDIDQAYEAFYDQYPDVLGCSVGMRVDYEEIDTTEPRIFRLT